MEEKEEILTEIANAILTDEPIEPETFEEGINSLEDFTSNESLVSDESNSELTEKDIDADIALNNLQQDNAKELKGETNLEETLNETEESDELAELKKEAKWYVLHTFSGYENVAKENLEIVIDKFNLTKRIFEIVIPMEDVVEEKNGKRKVVTRKLMPGYILVKMIYGDDIWHAVTRTRGITGFVGPKGRPLHLTEEEIRKMHLERLTVIDINIAPNDKVEVLEGPLNEFIGTVISVDAASAKCRVMVEMFGRETPVDLSLTQIRKIN